MHHCPVPKPSNNPEKRDSHRNVSLWVSIALLLSWSFLSDPGGWIPGQPSLHTKGKG